MTNPQILGFIVLNDKICELEMFKNIRKAGKMLRDCLFVVYDVKFYNPFWCFIHFFVTQPGGQGATHHLEKLS